MITTCRTLVFAICSDNYVIDPAKTPNGYNFYTRTIMDIYDARKLKIKLEDDISRLVLQFVKKTDVGISEIEVLCSQKTNLNGDRIYQLSGVNVITSEL